MTVTSYDEVPYPSYPYPETQPAHLAAVARLFGVDSPPPDACRVLELGCASGGNLVPLAAAWPGSTFLGVDLSARQVAEGKTRVQALGLGNVELRHADLLSVGPDLGRFDYVICHGVYSWVPAEVQAHILSVCRSCLAPRGVAYVSYNTFPGWHLMSAIRDMMLYHAGRFAAPGARIAQARAFLDFLARWSPARDDAYGTLLRTEAASLRQKSDPYLYHEHLEAVNDPIYFADFARRAQAAGLRYLAETQVRVMLPHDFPPEVQESLRLLAPDVLDLEQYLDFLRNRTFRRTLLCHSEVGVDRNLTGAGIEGMLVASPLQPGPPAGPTGGPRFVDHLGGTLETSDPVMAAILTTLGARWPQAIPFRDLRGGLTLPPGFPGPQLRHELEPARLVRRLLDYYLHGVVELHVVPPAAGKGGERPRGSSVAQKQALEGDRVTNLRHQTVGLSPPERQLLPLLDGRRAAAELTARGPVGVDGPAAALNGLAAKSLLVATERDLQGRDPGRPPPE